jgi:hypothetical protein
MHGEPGSNKRQRHMSATNASIESVDQRLQEWIGEFTGSAKVFLDSPAEMRDKQGVSFYLMEVVSDPPPRGVRPSPLRMLLRYLVTVWQEDPAKAHGLLGDLMFAAMENKDCEVEAGALPLAAWQTLGVAPRPSFLLKVPLRKARPETTGPRVNGKLAVQFGISRRLEGQVCGPNRLPIMGATVMLPSLQLRVRTDQNGRFRFASVPSEPPITHLQVNARGREVSCPVSTEAAIKPLLIELTEDQI